MTYQRDALRSAAFAAKAVSGVQLEEYAERMLRRTFPDNLLRPVRLDVIALLDQLEDLCRVNFGVEDMPGDEEGFTDPQRREIVIATAVYKRAVAGGGRDRQTCAHEVGHIPHIKQVTEIIRHGGPLLARRLNVQVKAYRDPEWQAERIGSALLMPRETVPVIFRKGGAAAVQEFYQVTPRNAEVRVSVLRGLNVL